METEGILTVIDEAANTIAAPNWADIWALVLSLVAILAATGVALFQARISNKQNKIALFEKRFSVYSEILKIVNLSDYLQSIERKHISDFFGAMELIFEIPISEEPDNDSMIF